MKKPPYTERRGGQWQYRRRVTPASLIPILGFGEYRESLRTADIEVARVRAAIRNAAVEVELQAAKVQLKRQQAIKATPAPATLSPAALQYIREAVRAHTLGQAVQASLTSNAKTQLELTKRCRTEAAWRLELAGGYSKSTIAKLVGVDESSIALMRKALREFKAEHPTADPKAFTWAHMRHWKRGPVERDGKDATLRRAEQFLCRTEKHLRGVSPEVLLTALDLHSPGMVAELVKVHKTMMDRTAYQCLPFGEIPNSAPENLDF